MAVDIDDWNARFAALVQSLALTDTEAERVWLRAPVAGAADRFKTLLREIETEDPARHAEILRLALSRLQEDSDSENEN